MEVAGSPSGRSGKQKYMSNLRVALLLGSLALALLGACTQATPTPTPTLTPTATPTLTSTPTPDEGRVILRVEPVEGSSRSFRFTAEIVGGPDNNPDLYCTGTRWDFGDGVLLVTSPDCAGWTPEVTIVRNFQQTHTSTEPGTFTVTFYRGQTCRGQICRTEPITIEVR